MKYDEIEQAIENGESVWLVFENKVYEIDKSKIIGIYDGCIIVYYNETYNRELCATTSDFYETRARAKHFINHFRVERIETLPFLTWEEFLEKKAIHFIDNKGIDFVLCITDNKIKLMVFFMVSKTWDLTEANFYKAYDECVRLFKGE